MLEVQELKKSFGGRQILDGVDLTVKDGEILCIVGPSGAGKTTLLRCITGLEAADSGKFLIDGRPFDPQGTDRSDSVIGVVFQDFNLFPNLTVLENVTLAPTLVLKKAKAAAQQDAVNLSMQYRSHGTDTLLDLVNHAVPEHSGIGIPGLGSVR